MNIYVDHTHLGRHVTGLERVTLELFSRKALAPLDVVPVTARGAGRMVTAQTFGLPMRLTDPSSILLCPGFPPSPLLRPFAARVIPYIHDMFLLSRRSDLNWRAKLYMAKPFELAVRSYPRFLVNSADTERKLSAYCRPDAEITLYRPPVRNVFNLSSEGRANRPGTSPLRLVALGTVEPRKNFVAAARILTALHEHGFENATLDILGRRGWGDDWRMLETCPGVNLHGYQSTDRVKQTLLDADAFICTSHEEGLGLPLLEAQYAGLPIIAPDAAIFREALEQSGIFIDLADLSSSARTISGAISAPGWRAAHVARGTKNLARWNALAASDHDAVINLVGKVALRAKPLAPTPVQLNRNDRSITP